MLVLTRKLNERIVVGDSIVVTVVQLGGSAVRIGIEAPPEVSILRDELRRRPAVAPVGPGTGGAAARSVCGGD